MKIRTLLLAAFFCLCISGPAAAAGDALPFSVQPQVINIDAGYDGTVVEAAGTIPSDSEIYLRLMGASCDLHLKEKGKVFGFMWMNLDSLVFHGLPSVCIVNASEIRSDSDAGAAGELGLKALAKNAEIESKSLDRESAFKEFIKLKEEEGLYREVGGAISYGPAQNGVKTFSARIPVPSRITPGDYVVESYVVRNGAIIDKGRQNLSVQLSGFPAFLANLAFGHSALYGILATLIALISGLAIGLLFQSKGAH